jgi:DNA anti-recombination protein RmuC
MLALTKTWIWIKHHWKIVAISAWTLFVWLMSRKNVDMYKKILENTIDNYKNEMEVLKSSRDKEQKDKEEAIRLRDESLERLEREFEHREESLSYEKRARYLELLESLSESPESVNKAIEEEFGFTYEE